MVSSSLIQSRSLSKLTSLIEKHLTQADCQRILMPSLCNSSLLSKTGRLEPLKDILFQVPANRMVLCPTHEEAVTSLMAGLPPISHRDLPTRLYQISSKFRDEMAPKYGLVRAREFIMKDLYTFDRNLDEARETYDHITDAYNAIFAELGVPYVRVRADNSSMGGSLSHEYHFGGAAVGEDRLISCSECGRAENAELVEEGSEERFYDCEKCGGKEETTSTRGVEVGHTFLLGTHYSDILKATYVDKRGKPASMHMGCYGLGVSRIMAAAVEVLSTEKEIRWPDSIAPFTACVLGPKAGSKEESAAGQMAEEVYDELDRNNAMRGDVVLDERGWMTVGAKLRQAKKTGYRFIVLLGKDTLAEEGRKKVEVHEVVNGQEDWKVTKLSPEEAVEYVSCKINRT